MNKALTRAIRHVLLKDAVEKILRAQQVSITDDGYEGFDVRNLHERLEKARALVLEVMEER